MMSGLWERLRGARRIELFAAMALLALLALLVLGRGDGTDAGQKTELEARMERMLSGIEGAGTVHVMITQDGEGRVSGALVVANGLRDVRTYLSLQSAVAKLLDLELSQIEIIGKDGGFGGTI